MKQTFKQVQNGLMVIATVEIETKKATVQWQDILEAVTVEQDDYQEALWDSCDGYDCKKISTDKYDYNADVKEMRGYTSHGRSAQIIEVKQNKTWREMWLPKLIGASKQVKAEMEAQALRVCTDYIVDWCNDKFTEFTVECEFEDYSNSCGGVMLCAYSPTSDDYYNEIAREVAREVVSEMEADGYTVEGQPDWQAIYIANQRDNKKRMATMKLKSDLWTKDGIKVESCVERGRNKKHFDRIRQVEAAKAKKALKSLNNYKWSIA